MSRRSTRARRSSSRVQEKIEELDDELKDIFDDSEEEAIGDDSDEDPDFEFRDEVQADEDEEFAAPDEEEDEDDYDSEAASRKRKREAAIEAMSKRQRTGENWNDYATPSHVAMQGTAAPGNNPYLQMIQSKYGFQGASTSTGLPDPQQQQQLLELRQQQLAQQQALAHQQRLRMLQQQQQQHAALQHWQNRATQPAHLAEQSPGSVGATVQAGGGSIPNVASLASAANAASNAATAFLARAHSGGGVDPAALSVSAAANSNAHVAALQAQQQNAPETAVGLQPPQQSDMDASTRLQQHLHLAQQQKLAQQQRLAQEQQLAEQQRLAQQQHLLRQQAQSPGQPTAQPQPEKLTMSQEDLQRVRQLLLEYKMAQQNPDENVRKQALHEARLKMRQYPQLVAVLRAAAQKTAIAAETTHPEPSGPQLQANRSWQQQMHEQALRQQYAERARALQVAKAQQVAMNDGEPMNLSIPFNSFNKSASTEDIGDQSEDVSETDQEIHKIMKQCEALAKRLAKLAKSQMENQELADAKKEIDEEAKKELTSSNTELQKDSDGDVTMASANSSQEETAAPLQATAPSENSVDASASEAKPEIATDESSSASSSEKKPDEPLSADKSEDTEKAGGGDGKDEKKKGNEDESNGPAIIRRQPESLRLKLTHYQLVGLNWLNLLHSEKLNGVLADEMGLGKTVQTIALFALLKARDQPKRPHLVVCPTTTLSNWVREFEVWCPSLAVMPYYGEMKEREQLRKVISDNHFDVIVTNYSAATGSARDRQFIKGMKFGYLVLDEAQYIKNKDSKRNKVLSKIKSENRLLLTGTPLQNNLDELWSLLQFIMPEFFKTAYEFDLMSEDEELTKRRINRMKTIIAPFFLRRLKTSPEVSQGIPEKKIIVEECAMTESQQKSYNNYISQSRKLWIKYKDMGDGKKEEDTLDKAEKAAPPSKEDETTESDSERPEDSTAQSTVPSTGSTAEDKETPTINESTSEENGDSADATSKDVAMENAEKKTPESAANEEEDEDMGADEEEEPISEDVVATAVEDVGLEDDSEFVQMPASSQQVNNIFMQLRKVANHPLLARTRFKQADMEEIIDRISLTPAYDGLSRPKVREDLERRSDFELSNMCSEIPGLEHYRLTQELIQDNGKCRRLAELLVDLKAKGHRVLLFSQMTRVLDILEVLISHWGYQYLRLDGSTPVVVRQGLIDRFTVDESLFLFLLSTGAGGVGINLTAADVVIFYDISFNPQVDRQAQDRVHRVGQKKPVTIYKLVCKGTVDEHMLRMADRKAKLNDDVLEEGTASKEEKKSKVWMLRSLLSEVFEDEEPEEGGRRRRRKGGAAKNSSAKRRAPKKPSAESSATPDAAPAVSASTEAGDSTGAAS